MARTQLLSRDAAFAHLFTNRFYMNVPYPNPYFDYDPIDYYKPKLLSGRTPPTRGLFYADYPHAANFFIDPDRGTELKNPCEEEHFAKVDQR